jgi:hypothetical protein
MPVASRVRRDSSPVTAPQARRQSRAQLIGRMPMDTPRTRDVGICTMPLALDRPKTPVRGYTLSLSGNSQFRHERCFFQGGASRRTDRLRLTSRAPQPNESSTTGTRNERQPEPAGRGASGYRRRQRDGRRHVAPRPGHGDATLVRPAAGVGRRPRGAAPCSPRRWGCTGRRFLASCPPLRPAARGLRRDHPGGRQHGIAGKQDDVEYKFGSLTLVAKLGWCRSTPGSGADVVARYGHASVK